MKKFRYFSLFLMSCIIILGCHSKNQFVEKQKNVSAVNISQGSALIGCKLLDVVNENNNYYSIITISTVIGYGPSTPPLAEDSDLKIRITENQFKAIEMYLEEVDKDFEFEIYKPLSGLGMNSDNVWKLNKIVKQ